MTVDAERRRPSARGTPPQRSAAGGGSRASPAPTQDATVSVASTYRQGNRHGAPRRQRRGSRPRRQRFHPGFGTACIDDPAGSDRTEPASESTSTSAVTTDRLVPAPTSRDSSDESDPRRSSRTRPPRRSDCPRDDDRHRHHRTASTVNSAPPGVGQLAPPVEGTPPVKPLGAVRRAMKSAPGEHRLHSRRTRRLTPTAPQPGDPLLTGLVMRSRRPLAAPGPPPRSRMRWVRVPRSLPIGFVADDQTRASPTPTSDRHAAVATRIPPIRADDTTGPWTYSGGSASTDQGRPAVGPVGAMDRRLQGGLASGQLYILEVRQPIGAGDSREDVVADPHLDRRHGAGVRSTCLADAQLDRVGSRPARNRAGLEEEIVDLPCRLHLGRRLHTIRETGIDRRRGRGDPRAEEGDDDEHRQFEVGISSLASTVDGEAEEHAHRDEEGLAGEHDPVRRRQQCRRRHDQVAREQQTGDHGEEGTGDRRPAHRRQRRPRRRPTGVHGEHDGEHTDPQAEPDEVAGLGDEGAHVERPVECAVSAPCREHRQVDHTDPAEQLSMGEVPPLADGTVEPHQVVRQLADRNTTEGHRERDEALGVRCSQDRAETVDRTTAQARPLAPAGQ